MDVDEASRQALYGKLDDVLGKPHSDALMAHLPPVGWAEVTTKQDLETSTTLVKLELHHAMGELRSELKSDMAELRSDLKLDMMGLRSELKGDMVELRTEFKSDIAELRTELKTDMVELRTELKTDIAALHVDIADLKTSIQREMRLQLVATLTLVVALVGLARLI